MGDMHPDAPQKMIPQEKAKAMLREGDLDCKTLVDSDVVGVRVMSVDPCGKDWVYDLSCEGNHNFFANNLLCHNCVLWVDEIEKALSAAVGKGSGDSGTTKRVLSTFLTWAQEKTAQVFLACTANNVEDIPPEFMRAGRFDEVFFIDLPDEEGRQQIIEIMLRLRGFDANSIKPGTRGLTIKKVAAHKHLDGFSGAEIEKAVNEAMFIAFKDGMRQVTLADIVEAAGTFKPLSKMREAEFEAMRKWAGENTRIANTGR
jgi:ATP-dependent 26S proteasome regulatory subunit